MGYIVLYYSITIQFSKLLLVLASTVILGSESHGTHGHILKSDGSGSLQTSLLYGRNTSLNLHEGMGYMAI
jgi:hypothetical protein